MQFFTKDLIMSGNLQLVILSLAYSKVQTVSAQFKLSWSHYLILMRMDNISERNFYSLFYVTILLHKL